MNTHEHSSSRGFSLIELLIVAAIIGLIVAIAIPNLINAIQRSRQTRTISDLRTISNGLGIYQQDYAKFPPAASLAAFSDVSDDLVPFIGANVPTTDAWHMDLQYKSDGDTYSLASTGANKVVDLPWTSGITAYFDEDIVILDGSFLQIPQGEQN
jgi:prepilin-type N-terminal cleavage/methylation domain-containing protein